MSEYDYDLFVIGGGSGGTRASRMAANFGAKVAVAEEYRMGGTCVIRGCIPKKLLAYASHFAEDFADARGFGWTVPEASFSWPELIRNKNVEIARLSSIYESIVDKAGAALLRGHASLEDAHTVSVNGQRVTAKYILIATGGRPRLPYIEGVEHAITSNEAFDLPDLPKQIVIVGGGYIAVEFAGIFHGLGADVTIVHRGNEILRGFDQDVRSHLHTELAKKGINIQCGSEIGRIEKGPDGRLTAHLKGNGVKGDGEKGRGKAGEGSLAADTVMYATGRSAATASMGLAEAGVKLDESGGVVVDHYCRSSVSNIFAVGDVTHRIALTPVAIREGAAVANTLFNDTPTPVDHDNIPSAVFSQPPVGTVGLTEEDALKKHGELEIYKTTFRPLKHALSGRDERTLMKLIVEPKSQRVLGAHMVGADAAEVIQGIAIAVKAELTKKQFDATVAIHPTVAEEFVTLKDKQIVKA